MYNVCKQSGIFRLFPGKEFLAPENPIENPLKGGAIYWFPGKSRWLKQDESVGDEKIYVVASRSRNTVLEDLYAHLEHLIKQGDSSQASKDAQEMIKTYLDTTMGATHVLPQKVPTTDPAGADQKIRAFEEAARIFEASGLDGWNRYRSPTRPGKEKRLS